MLTFFSGFGLGTLLSPVMMLFFPVETAIALTGIVHFFNNIFKLALVGRHADRSVLLKFGLPALLAAFIGARLLLGLGDLNPLFSYGIGGTTLTVLPVKFIIGLLLVFFALMDLVPALSEIRFSRNKLVVGGFLSGFFGGLSGNQGALRSAFLIKSGLSKEAYLGTAVVVSCFVDFTRISVYTTHFSAEGLAGHAGLLVAATLSAMSGAFLGNRLFRKVTILFIQRLVAVMLFLVALALMTGWI
ncbi:MAG: hypothetical protein RL213_144 [Bacteroidota bacterium]